MRRTPNIHERFLRHIWSKQYLKANLKTSDGRSMKVIDVGQLNNDGGPDFINAKIKINDITYFGDIEIHRTVFDWIKHQHQEDPRYNKVILHVVLKSNNEMPTVFVNSGRKVPLLILDKYLSESIHSIWQKVILDERLERTSKIACYEKNTHKQADLIRKWLLKLSIERLEVKLSRLEERLHELAYEELMNVCERQNQYGELKEEGNYNEIPLPIPKLKLTQKDFSSKDIWEQLLYEGIMEVLGYSKNREPFIKLARNVSLKFIRTHKMFDNVLGLESLLFGASGLIPKNKELKDPESREYVANLLEKWDKIKVLVNFELLHQADWQFFPTRPLNFPTLRIAAASIIINKLITEDMFRSIIQLLKSYENESAKIKELLKLFKIETFGYWRKYYHFDVIAKREHNLLGEERMREILINIILPLAFLYARIFKDMKVHNSVLNIYKSIKFKQKNSIIKLMEDQLIKGRVDLTIASHQQALIHLYKYYCVENKCRECELNN